MLVLVGAELDAALEPLLLQRTLSQLYKTHKIRDIMNSYYYHSGVSHVAGARRCSKVRQVGVTRKLGGRAPAADAFYKRVCHREHL